MRVAFALLLWSAPAWTQASIGVKGGVPLNDALETPIPTTRTQRFTLGPSLEFRFPMGFGLEFDILYKRFEASGRRGSSWEFPLLGKYRFSGEHLRPYVEAGPTFQRLGGLPVPLPFTTGSETRKGLAMGAGIELRLPVIRVSGGLRYSHWGDTPLVRSTNLVDFLLGVSF